MDQTTLCFAIWIFSKNVQGTRWGKNWWMVRIEYFTCLLSLFLSFVQTRGTRSALNQSTHALSIYESRAKSVFILTSVGWTSTCRREIKFVAPKLENRSW